MSHYPNNQSNGKHLVNDDTTIIGKRYQMIREINVSSGNYCTDSQNWKTYLAQDTGIIGNPFCVVKEIPLSADCPSTKLPQKISWDELVTIQQKLGDYPEIPRILAYFTEKSYLYVIREYLEGETLANQLQSRTLTQTEAFKLFLDILDVVEFIHSNHLIHGNIQPQNIIQLKSNDKYTLIDFDDIQKVILDENSLIEKTISTLVVNTSSFFAPEQTAGQPIISSDFYSLGKILIYSLTKSLFAQWEQDIQNQQIVKKLDPQFKKILRKTIIPNVKARYHSTKEIREALLQIENVSTIIHSNPDGLAMDSLPITDTGSASSQIQPPRNTISLSIKKPRPIFIVLSIIVLSALVALGELINPILRPLYYVSRGKQALAEEPQIALDKFQTAIDLKSRNSVAWKGRGDALFFLERYRSALLAYDKAIEIQPKNAAASWKGRGNALFRLERFEAALTAYNKSLQIQPDNPEAFNRQGRALYRLERQQEALKAQETALEIKPNYAQALSDRGIVLIGLGQYENALKSFEDAQAIEPLNPEIWQNKALAWQYLGRNQEAFRLYQEALESYNSKLQKDATNVTALIDKGNVLTKLKQHKEAIKAYDRAIAVNPNSHLAWLNRGNAFFALGRFDEALKSFDRALKIAPESYLTWHNRGSLLRDGKQDFQEAIASYKRATSLNPSFYHAWRDMGLAHSQSGQQYLALKHFQTALEIKPEDYQSWVGRGIAFSSLNKTKEAIAAFSRAGELQPQDPFVWMNKAYALEKARQYGEACEAYEKVVQINPTLSSAIEGMERLNCQS
ncbi:Tetratricopeptide repeat protein,protein kinase family protein [Hyella patelloides LEGE 07179]|uniref:Tetratricopeptide repeat protein,protein kinase family protein n=1 Tax=Hyella patelloides LEGE 07179 TaxID=945734 RepID=A0A563VMK8_9CYAN|nr:tetratricopeptide repeat protein [Hyella patelloides]VEP12651.1 Tetratricopeptide repeat protein,protein kinase family protein [Hyella patelloides LEGE 07179]